MNGGTVAYATDAAVPRVSVLQAIENFLQDSLADGRGAPHFVRTHSRVFFPDQVYSPSRSFQFCTPTVTISISFTPTTPRPPAYAPASALSLSRNDRVFFGSHFPFFRVPHPPSDNQLHRPQRAANLLELGSSHFAHRWLAKRWRIQHQASLARATPNSTALPRSLLSPSPSLIGRSREGPQRPPPSSSIPPFPSGKEGGDV